jgi:hypothetical protein
MAGKNVTEALVTYVTEPRLLRRGGRGISYVSLSIIAWHEAAKTWRKQHPGGPESQRHPSPLPNGFPERNCSARSEGPSRFGEFPVHESRWPWPRGLVAGSPDRCSRGRERIPDSVLEGEKLWERERPSIGRAWALASAAGAGVDHDGAAGREPRRERVAQGCGCRLCQCGRVSTKGRMSPMWLR